MFIVSFKYKKFAALFSLLFLVALANNLSRPNETQASRHWRGSPEIYSVRRKQFFLLQQQHPQPRVESDQSRGSRK